MGVVVTPPPPPLPPALYPPISFLRGCKTLKFNLQEFFLAAPANNATLLLQIFRLPQEGVGLDIMPVVKKMLGTVHLS